jgi:serine/threonine protein kinase
MDLAECSLTRYFGERNESGAGRPCLTAEEAVDILRQVCAGVRALHAHPGGIIHRDINPNNILRLPDGRWALADFGLAKFVNQAPSSTAFVSLTQHKGLGTPFYGAPEQYQNFKLTGVPTDVHALGMLVWELFSDAWPPPDRDDLGLPEPLAAVWSRATARNPERRYASVDAFELAVLDALNGTALR